MVYVIVVSNFRSASQNGGKTSNLNASASNVVNTSEIVRETTCTKTSNLALKNKESDKVSKSKDFIVSEEANDINVIFLRNIKEIFLKDW